MLSAISGNFQGGFANIYLFHGVSVLAASHVFVITVGHEELTRVLGLSSRLWGQKSGSAKFGLPRE